MIIIVIFHVSVATAAATAVHIAISFQPCNVTSHDIHTNTQSRSNGQKKNILEQFETESNRKMR